MPACPNCDRQTARTEDWACQWCGYPLRSTSFPVVHKTFRQLQQERLKDPTPVTQSAPDEIEAKQAEDEAWREAEMTSREQAEREAIKAEEKARKEIETLEQAAKQARQAAREEEKRAAEEAGERSRQETEGQANLEEQAWQEAMRLSQEQAEKEQREAEDRAAAASAAQEAAAKAIQLTVDELSAEFKADGSAAHNKYANSVLRLTGSLSRVVANEINHNYFVTLASDIKEPGLRDVRCKFDPEHAAELQQLAGAKTATVQGRYSGAVIDINLTNCLLIS